MSAYEWRKAMTAAPVLRHENGMVFATMNGLSVWFPSEAAARFFHAAYYDVPALVEQNAHLRSQIDEGALAVAQERVRALEAEVATLKAEKVALQAKTGVLAEKAATAVRRARVLAIALKGKVQP